MLLVISYSLEACALGMVADYIGRRNDRRLRKEILEQSTKFTKNLEKVIEIVEERKILPQNP